MDRLLRRLGGHPRRAATLLVVGVLVVALAGVSAPTVWAAAGSQAPGAPGQAADWSPG